MPRRLVRRAFVSQRPISRQHWPVFRAQDSILLIQLPLQLVGIQWEGMFVAHSE